MERVWSESEVDGCSGKRVECRLEVRRKGGIEKAARSRRYREEPQERRRASGGSAVGWGKVKRLEAENFEQR